MPEIPQNFPAKSFRLARGHPDFDGNPTKRISSEYRFRLARPRLDYGNLPVIFVYGDSMDRPVNLSIAWMPFWH